MDIRALFMWHREQQERFAWLADNHKTTGGGQCHRDAVTRRNLKLAQFHADAAKALKEVIDQMRAAMSSSDSR